MAGHTFEERLTQIEEQLKALQALTQGLAAWEMGATAKPDREAVSERSNAHEPSFAAIESGSHYDDNSRREHGEPRARG